ncbi:MAG: hypothetical protein JWM32_2170 [Verrucomicrobia bacterium]|nr:hypothetical protein [Verrucomicrobiota bacterium]
MHPNEDVFREGRSDLPDFAGTFAFVFRAWYFSPTGRIAVYTERGVTSDIRYFHTDGLGSLTAVSNEYGLVAKRFAFDAWGKRLVLPTNAPGPGVLATSANIDGYTRGFTDHEQLDDLGLVHMHGRIYDLVLGRFLSADSNLDSDNDPQAFNRYAWNAFPKLRRGSNEAAALLAQNPIRHY